jgi:hypothetical protein
MGRLKKSKTVKATPDVLQEIKYATDSLIRVCDKHGLAVGGFVFSGSVPLILFNFGNTSEAKEIEFYEKLVRLADAQRQAGRVQHLKPSRVC